jgi:DNA-binding NarL/FixJ family response regulator
MAGSAEARALAARARALLADGAEADRLFEEALRAHAATDRLLDRARTQLLYGEHLRRERRRVDAREALRAALDTFEALGAASWAERARTELRATGETARRRDPSTLDQLTQQELQVVRTVSQGATNREAAAQLFISPRTVDHHLRSVFRKLGLRSRAELVRFVVAGEASA